MRLALGRCLARLGCRMRRGLALWLRATRLCRRGFTSTALSRYRPGGCRFETRRGLRPRSSGPRLCDSRLTRVTFPRNGLGSGRRMRRRRPGWSRAARLRGRFGSGLRTRCCRRRRARRVVVCAGHGRLAASRRACGGAWVRLSSTRWSGGSGAFRGICRWSGCPPMSGHQWTCSTASRIRCSRCGRGCLRSVSGTSLRRRRRVFKFRIEFSPGAAGSHHAWSAQCARLPGCGYRRYPVIHGRPLRAIGTRRIRMLQLDGSRRIMSPARCRQLSRRRPGSDPAGAAVVAHVVHGDVVDHRLVVDVGDVGRGDVVHGPVVEKGAVVPIAARVSQTGVAETVVNAPIKADCRPPVSGVPSIHSVIPSPVAGCPEGALKRRHYPRARHPVVAVIRIPRPVSGRPDISRPGADRLFVNRQRRRCNSHRYADAKADLGARGCRRQQHGRNQDGRGHK